MKGKRYHERRPLRSGYGYCPCCEFRQGRHRGQHVYCEVCWRRLDRGEIPDQDDLVTFREALRLYRVLAWLP